MAKLSRKNNQKTKPSIKKTNNLNNKGTKSTKSAKNKNTISSLFTKKSKKGEKVRKHKSKWNLLSLDNKNKEETQDIEDVSYKVQRSGKVLRTTVKDENSSFTKDMSLLDKFRLASLYKDKITGKKDELEVKEAIKSEKIYLAKFTTLKKFLLTQLSTYLDGNKCASISIQIDENFSSVISPVLNSTEFIPYTYIELRRNVNLVKLGKDVPRCFIFRLKK